MPFAGERRIDDHCANEAGEVVIRNSRLRTRSHSELGSTRTAVVDGRPRSTGDRHTVAKGMFISVLTSAASVAASRAPFFGHLLPDLVLQGELTDLAFGVTQSPVVLSGGLLAFQALFAGVHELVTPGCDAMGFDPHLTAQLLELLAAKQAQYYIEFLAGRPPCLGAEVLSFIAAHRHESHFGSSLFGVQRTRVRETACVKMPPPSTPGGRALLGRRSTRKPIPRPPEVGCPERRVRQSHQGAGSGGQVGRRQRTVRATVLVLRCHQQLRRHRGPRNEGVPLSSRAPPSLASPPCISRQDA